MNSTENDNVDDENDGPQYDDEKFITAYKTAPTRHQQDEKFQEVVKIIDSLGTFDLKSLLENLIPEHRIILIDLLLEPEQFKKTFRSFRSPVMPDIFSFFNEEQQQHFLNLLLNPTKSAFPIKSYYDFLALFELTKANPQHLAQLFKVSLENLSSFINNFEEFTEIYNLPLAPKSDLLDALILQKNIKLSNIITCIGEYDTIFAYCDEKQKPDLKKWLLSHEGLKTILSNTNTNFPNINAGILTPMDFEILQGKHNENTEVENFNLDEKQIELVFQQMRSPAIFQNVLNTIGMSGILDLFQDSKCQQKALCQVFKNPENVAHLKSARQQAKTKDPILFKKISALLEEVMKEHVRLSTIGLFSEGNASMVLPPEVASIIGNKLTIAEAVNMNKASKASWQATKLLKSGEENAEENQKETPVKVKRNFKK